MLKPLAAAASLLLAATLGAFAQGAGKPSPEVMKDLAPTGKIRAAINFGNAVLAQKDEAGKPKGITPDLANELGRRLGVSVEFVPFEAAGKVFAAAKEGKWDIGFIAADPARAGDIEFSAAYLLIEGTYMVRKDSPLKDVGDVDKPGIRVAVGLGSAYDPFLTRSLKQAQVVRASAGGGRAMIELFVKDNLDACAGVRQQLESYARDHPEMRVMSGRFQEIQQAMGTPKGRTAGGAYLRAFVEEMKASGFVAEAIKRAGQTAQVAPPAK